MKKKKKLKEANKKSKVQSISSDFFKKVSYPKRKYLILCLFALNTLQNCCTDLNEI